MNVALMSLRIVYSGELEGHGMNVFMSFLLGATELFIFMTRFWMLKGIALIQHILQGGAW